MTDKDMIEDLCESIDPQTILKALSLQYGSLPSWEAMRTMGEGTIWQSRLHELKLLHEHMEQTSETPFDKRLQSYIISRYKTIMEVV